METTFDQKIKNLDPIANGILFNWDILEIYSADGIAFDSETIFEYKLEAK